MASFRVLAREALRQAIIQCQRLMYDWEPADPNLSNLRDPLSTAKSGYSFVTDPANGLNDAFSEELKRISRTIPSIPREIGVQLYRQLSIAIAEKYVRGAASGFNRFDDTTNTASEDAVFAWQSVHRPMQRYHTYGLDGAFPDQLQPALLRIYARTSTDWHNFLSIKDGEELGSADTNDDTSQDRPSKEAVLLKWSQNKISSCVPSTDYLENASVNGLNS
ncbi:hypothetical protein FOVG_19209 [Fusarium oxysporum f. sp. pisi HDV247]|uniref:Uncharacterized protein n=1 Tax=Fusarium oxysporum f. sp. pisi HDV247 TaxID=1080344 RepID=W9N957_FUSOX|nr:hypothetical protein FOVG_19209 [Fusarium oxysporum f. sp. pisi HDV247]